MKRASHSNSSETRDLRNFEARTLLFHSIQQFKTWLAHCHFFFKPKLYLNWFLFRFWVLNIWSGVDGNTLKVLFTDCNFIWIWKIEVFGQQGHCCNFHDQVLNYFWISRKFSTHRILQILRWQMKTNILFLAQYKQNDLLFLVWYLINIWNIVNPHI